MSELHHKLEEINGVTYYKARTDEVTLKDGTKFTVATWGESVATRLPKVDAVGYVDSEDNISLLLWQDFYDIGEYDTVLALPSGRIFVLTPERPTDEQRARMKMASFSLMSSRGLSKLKASLKR